MDFLRNTGIEPTTFFEPRSKFCKNQSIPKPEFAPL